MSVLFVCLFRYVEKPEHVLLLFTLHQVLPSVNTSSTSYNQGQGHMKVNSLLDQESNTQKVGKAKRYNTGTTQRFLHSASLSRCSNPSDEPFPHLQESPRTTTTRTILLVINSVVTSVSTNLNWEHLTIYR